MKALEQESTEFEEIDFVQEHKKIPITLNLTPHEDAVSRQAVDKLKSDIMNWINSDNRGTTDYFIVDKIEELVKNFNPPSVQPKPKTEWIPISKRLPRSNGVYQVTIQCDEGRYTSACYFDGSNTWHDDNRINHDRPYVTDKVIAWQEEPEPYKKNEDEE